jgi:hypothetical protein
VAPIVITDFSAGGVAPIAAAVAATGAPVAITGGQR